MLEDHRSERVNDSTSSFFLNGDEYKSLLDTYINGPPTGATGLQIFEYIFLRIFEYITYDVHSVELREKDKTDFKQLTMEQFALASNSTIRCLRKCLTLRNFFVPTDRESRTMEVHAALHIVAT